MKKRILVLGILFSWMLLLAAGRLILLTADPTLQAQSEKGAVSLTLPGERGSILDRNGLPLTNQTSRFLAALTATPSVATELHRTLGSQKAAATLESLQNGKPLLVEVPETFSAQGALVLRQDRLYEDDPLAVHLLGYLNNQGQGVCGIQAAFDSVLDSTQSTRIRFAADARGQVLLGVEPTVESPDRSLRGQVTLTLDRSLQQAVEQAVSGLLDQGAVVVVDTATSQILASVSLPDYHPEQVGDILSREDAPLLNRAFSAYNTGSVFKLCVAAAALEAGFSPEEEGFCTGQIDCHGQIFHCHEEEGHGALTMEQALSVSCNTYFIQLAAKVGAEQIFAMAQALGLGQKSLEQEGLGTSAGNLPDVKELSRIPAALANFSLGQGDLMTTPLQIALMTAAIANDGRFTPAQLVLSTHHPEQGDEIFSAPQSTAVFSPQTAQTLRQMMVSVVEGGTGQAAKPLSGGAGGKTATAQTGLKNNLGQSVTQAWFAGFFPADKPRYGVAVLVEGGTSGGSDAAPVFAAVANAIQKETENRS